MCLLTALCVTALATCITVQVATIPLTKFQHNGTYIQTRARTASLKSRAYGEPVTVPAASLGGAAYVASIGIGRPPTYYNLVEVGSSNIVCE